MSKKNDDNLLENGYVHEFSFSDQENILKFSAFSFSFKFVIFFKITRTIDLNRERSVQFLKQNAFLTYSWRFPRSNTLDQLEFKLKKKWE